MKKRFFSLVLIVLATLIFVSCAKESGNGEQNTENNNLLNEVLKVDEAKEAETAVKEMFTAFKSFNLEKAQKYVDVEEILSASETNENSKLFMESVFKSLEYSIVSSEKIDSTNIVVKTSITAIDMKTVMADFFTKAMQYAFSTAFADPQPTEEETNKKMEEILLECISNPELTNVTNEVDVNVSKVNKEWKVDADDTFINAVLGGLVEASNELQNSFASNEEETSSIEEITFTNLHNWLVGDIWNDGFCDLSCYYSDGTSSTGGELDAEFSIERLTKAYEDKSKYDAFVDGLSDEYEELKSVYAKLSSEIDALYSEVIERGTEVIGEGLPTDKYQQYADVLYDILWDLM